MNDPASTTPDPHVGLQMAPRRVSRSAPLGRFTAWLTSDVVVGVACATGVALVLSTQLLAQPFVWGNFPLDVIAAAWASTYRNRLVVAASIAAAIVAVRALPLGSGLRAAAIGIGIAAGAVGGESLLLHFGYESDIGGMSALLPRTVRWCVIAFVITTIMLLLGRASASRTAVHDATLRAARIERQAIESRLQLLRAQIEPHFLFNTLATIRQLHRSAPEDGASMLGNLIDYLQAALPKSRDTAASVRDELDLVRAYLGLIEVRMSGLLTWSVTADDALLDHPFPPLSLSTLVENAIKHGIVPSPSGGHVAVTVRRAGAAIEATVVDDGAGMTPKASGTGIGLANTRARLVSLHGAAATLSLMHHVPSGVRAVISIPA